MLLGTLRRNAVAPRSTRESTGRPTEPFHVFAFDVEAAGFVVFGEDAFGMAWDPDRGLRRWTRRHG